MEGPLSPERDEEMIDINMHDRPMTFSASVVLNVHVKCTVYQDIFQPMNQPCPHMYIGASPLRLPSCALEHKTSGTYAQY